jgi:hypothetical protein
MILVVDIPAKEDEYNVYHDKQNDKVHAYSPLSKDVAIIKQSKTPKTPHEVKMVSGLAITHPPFFPTSARDD